MKCCEECQEYLICQIRKRARFDEYEEEECCDICDDYIECKRMSKMKFE